MQASFIIESGTANCQQTAQAVLNLCSDTLTHNLLIPLSIIYAHVLKIREL